MKKTESANSTNTITSWVAVETRVVESKTSVSIGDCSQDQHQKRVALSGSYSGRVALSYNTVTEAERRENLQANGIVPKIASTSNR